MRLPLSAFLALPSVLNILVLAAPSPAAYLQDPISLPLTSQRQSWWKSISNGFIELVWRPVEAGDHRVARQNRLDNPSLPRNTLARYGDDVVLRFNVTTSEEARKLAEAADILLLDVWDFTHEWVDIRVTKTVVPSLLGLLPSTLQQSHTPLFYEGDLARAVHNTYPSPDRPQTISAISHSHDRQSNSLFDKRTDDVESSIFFKEYRPLSVIEPWMRLFSRIYSTHVRLINVGLSYEGRPILGMRVGVRPIDEGNRKPPKRKTVLVTGGMHAREWISTSTVNYVAFNLITSYGQTSGVTELLKEYDFVFIPTVNPDGYAYTWEVDRLWRKNRQETTVRFCRGIDLDRGFGFEWDAVSTAGNPCSESYAGESPFEAVESKRLAEWARNETQNNNVEFVGFLDLHSYSQQILYPYSYSCDDTPPSQENLEELALGMEKAIRRSSSFSYEPMPACEGNVVGMNGDGKHSILPRIEHSGGSPLDWFYHEMHVRFAYQIKLRDRGTYGFLLPKENIIPTGKEILNAVLYFGEFLQEGYPKLSKDSNLEEAKDSSASETPDIAIEKALDSADEESRWDLRRRRRR